MMWLKISQHQQKGLMAGDGQRWAGHGFGLTLAPLPIAPLRFPIDDGPLMSAPRTNDPMVNGELPQWFNAPMMQGSNGSMSYRPPVDGKEQRCAS
jgi:hypothetical protein